MEKQMKATAPTTRKSLLKALLVGLLAMNSFSVLQAQQSSTPILNAEIKYIGLLNDRLIFQVDYHNIDQKNFFVEIEDQEGYQFYSAKSNKLRFSQKYAIDKAELGNNKISFTVSSGNKVKREVFDVSASSKTVEELNIVKL